MPHAGCAFQNAARPQTFRLGYAGAFFFFQCVAGFELEPISYSAPIHWKNREPDDASEVLTTHYDCSRFDIRSAATGSPSAVAAGPQLRHLFVTIFSLPPLIVID
jgi:hypothetical protein